MWLITRTLSTQIPLAYINIFLRDLQWFLIDNILFILLNAKKLPSFSMKPYFVYACSILGTSVFSGLNVDLLKTKKKKRKILRFAKTSWPYIHKQKQCPVKFCRKIKYYNVNTWEKCKFHKQNHTKQLSKIINNRCTPCMGSILGENSYESWNYDIFEIFDIWYILKMSKKDYF